VARALLALLLLSACQPTVEVRPRSEAPKDAVLRDATLSIWRGNTSVVTARAREVTWYRQDGRFVAETVAATLPSKQGPVELTAPKVEGNVTGEALDASGGVVVTSARGTGKSPTAHCENGPDGTIVSSNDGVVFQGEGNTLVAKSFRFESNAQHARFEGVETVTRGDGK
jgi:lipopolysaccharide export system protein LptC